ncbi:hypothetical protein SAY87_013305 [Trapa incisa]|uniref:Uncharacterized protein n=1 Tax=Trapa incisa TaxID=236973 RepID=A0AAN7KHX8_9MYRT|nr:hypothetical protein SAY87_013305 [Trapa incisa]
MTFKSSDFARKVVPKGEGVHVPKGEEGSPACNDRIFHRTSNIHLQVIDQLAAGRLLVMPAEEHDNAPPDDVELSPLLAEGPAEPSAREPPLASAAAHLHHRHLYVSEVLDSRNEEKRNERIE